MPPIFQPEIAADAIAYASRHPRREFVVGWPALKAILANKFVPGVVDRVLARQGYAGQQTATREDPNRPDNLWAPAPGDHAAHGRFDDRARSTSVQWWLTRHRAALALATLGGGLLGAALLRRRRGPDAHG